jgi:hypothetical protein
MEQGVEIVDFLRGIKIGTGMKDDSQEGKINSAIRELNREGKRVISVQSLIVMLQIIHFMVLHLCCGKNYNIGGLKCIT